MIRLKLAQPDDAAEILDMQIRAFMPLYEKYHDDDTSPVKESVERVRGRICDPASKYYFIDLDGVHAGAIRAQAAGDACRVSPIFVLPEYQGRGVAQQAMKFAEGEFPHAKRWILVTIAQEPGNCHLYEKLGYVRFGTPEVVNERMTLIGYEKQI